MRKKISVGFFTLALLLFFAGMVSLFELNKLSERTRNILETSSNNTELAKLMLDAAEAQNSSLLEMIVLEKDRFDSVFTSARGRLDQALQSASDLTADRSELNAIYSAKNNYYELVTGYFDDETETDVAWFLEIYKTTYNHLTSAIKNYMMAAQQQVVDKAGQVEDNAYRAIMPGIITLIAAIIIVLMFSLLLDIYYSRPIVLMNKGLSDYLKFKVPFRVPAQGKDEIGMLRDNIDSLVTAARSKSPEER